MPNMIIKNAFATTTAKGHKIFRIFVDINEVLTNTENGNNLMAIDILTKNGLVKTYRGTSKTGKPYEAMQYYTWATRKEQVPKGA